MIRPTIAIFLVVLGVSAIIASTWTSPVCALSCGGYTHEVITLELESVTEDGVELDDVTDYEPFAVHLEGSPYDDDPGFTLFAVENETNTWLEAYR